MKTLKNITIFVSRTAFVLLIAIIVMSGCNIFGNEEKEDELGWRKISMPSKLKGKWNKNNVLHMEVTSKKIHMANREWILESIFEKDGETRIIGRSALQYKAFYFKLITDTSMEFCLGFIDFTIYKAKLTERGSWLELLK